MCYTCIEYSLSLLGIDKITNKRSKEKMKKVFIGIIAIIMVLGLVGCSSTPAEETNTAEPTEQRQLKQRAKHHRIKLNLLKRSKWEKK